MNNQFPFFYPFDRFNQENNDYNKLNDKLNRLEKKIRILETRLNKIERKDNKKYDILDDEPTDMYII